MNIPIETVVELLVENAAPAKCGGGQIRLGGELYDSLQVDQLRGYIRVYLQSLIPPPVLLSECEEGKPFKVERSEIVVRRDCGAYRWTDNKPLGFAEHFQVIQPVEVNCEL